MYYTSKPIVIRFNKKNIVQDSLDVIVSDMI